MIQKNHHYRYLPHFFGFTVLVILGLMIFFLLTQKAHSTLKIIDVHEHIETLEKTEILAEVNRELNIEQTALLVSPIETITLNGNESFTHYRENADEILKIAEEFPGEFLPFCTVSPLDADALEYIKSCIERGGKGIKLYNGHSYYYGVFNMPLDSPRMMPVYSYAERNKIPVLYHVNIDNYGDELENVLRKYPDLVMDIPHFMVSSMNLEKVERLFDKYPNLYTDISFGSPEYLAAGFRRISNDTQKYIDFISKYPGRILFGTDMVITETESKDHDFIKSTIQCYKDILEKKNFTCGQVSDYYGEEARKLAESYNSCKPEEGKYCLSIKEKLKSHTKWHNETKTLNGLGLSGEILQKIYWENPLNFLSANQIR
jgi:predicted TIM-barrel fold metal-dependent hydrolase